MISIKIWFAGTKETSYLIVSTWWKNDVLFSYSFQGENYRFFDENSTLFKDVLKLFFSRSYSTLPIRLLLTTDVRELTSHNVSSIHTAPNPTKWMYRKSKRTRTKKIKRKDPFWRSTLTSGWRQRCFSALLPRLSLKRRGIETSSELVRKK